MAVTGTVLDHFPTPPCAQLLGWTLLDHDPEKGWVKLAFEAKREFLNPAGYVQGGMLTAMLDDTMGPALLLMTRGKLYTTTIDMSVSFLAPARPGKLIAEGRVIQLGKTIAFLEAQLSDSEGHAVARATASARLVPMDRLAA
jgi:uncharacterized protein (TIGR00369 family)